MVSNSEILVHKSPHVSLGLEVYLSRSEMGRNLIEVGEKTKKQRQNGNLMDVWCLVEMSEFENELQCKDVEYF